MRIQDELLKLGYRVDASTVRRVLKALKIPPAPKRHTDITWRKFLHAQAATMLATVLFHVDCAVTLQRLDYLFVMEVGSRSVHILGITANPDGPWTVQQIRSLLMDLGDRAADFRFLVRDRARQFTASFDAVLAGAGVEAAKIPQPSRERLCGEVRAHRPDGGHRPDADLRPATSADDPGRVRGPLRPTTAPSQPPAPAAPAPTTLSATSPRSGSIADPSSAASSTNTSGPHRSPGQAWWPSSETPQGAAKCRRGTVRLSARLVASMRYQASRAMPIRSATATREACCVVCGSCSSGANPCEPSQRDEGRLGPG